MRGELYEYNGQMLTQVEIARLENINRSTLADNYKRTGNMEEAVRQTKENNKTRWLEYNGETMAITAIAHKEGLKIESLQRFYEYANHDIYEAVRLTKEAKLKRNGSILYNGRMMSILAIANENGLEHHSLGNYYKQTNDIYKAVEITKEAQNKHRGIIEYKGSIMSISGIAELEEIKRDTLKEYYELYGNIEKAVFITKESQLKRKQALLKGKQASYEELARQFDISVIELDKMINAGVSVDALKKKAKKGISSEQQLRYDEDSLYKYCLKHSYNYWVINYLIKVYGKTPEEAVKAYVENGQQLPIKWIYEKYGLLFKHLTLNFGLDSNRIIKIIRDNNCSIEEAITKLVFISNNDNNDFKKAEIDWMEELYSFIKDMPENEYLEVKKAFYITDREEKYLNNKKVIIDQITRQLLLYEFSNIIEEWPTNELMEMMKLYNVSEEEKKTIVLDLCAPFKNMVIDPTGQSKERNNIVKNIIIDSTINNDTILSNPSLSIQEKQEILKKREILSKIIPQKIQNESNALK